MSREWNKTISGTNQGLYFTELENTSRKFPAGNFFSDAHLQCPVNLYLGEQSNGLYPIGKYQHSRRLPLEYLSIAEDYSDNSRCTQDVKAMLSSASVFN